VDQCLEKSFEIDSKIFMIMKKNELLTLSVNCDPFFLSLQKELRQIQIYAKDEQLPPNVVIKVSSIQYLTPFIVLLIETLGYKKKKT